MGVPAPSATPVYFRDFHDAHFFLSRMLLGSNRRRTRGSAFARANTLLLVGTRKKVQETKRTPIIRHISFR